MTVHRTRLPIVGSGHPSTAVSSGDIRISPWSMKTSVPGFSAAGDRVESVYRQAAAMGCMAALEAGKFIAGRSAEPAVQAEERNARPMIGADARART